MSKRKICMDIGGVINHIKTKNITGNHDIQTVVSFKACQNISKEVKDWVLIDHVT